MRGLGGGEGGARGVYGTGLDQLWWSRHTMRLSRMHGKRSRKACCHSHDVGVAS